jgi:F420-0:gamma-glutamyl ligase
MIVRPVKTDKILPNSIPLFDFLDKYLDKVDEQTVVALTSKVVSLCEGRAVAAKDTDKERLSEQEAEYYFPAENSKYNHHFTIIHDTLLGMSGIDESNGDGYYILLPNDPQTTANNVRRYLRDKYKLKDLGVIITDSVSTPLRLGAVGAAIGYSGFRPVNDYRGQADLFGRPFKISQANVAAGLAAAAVLAMGEGAEQTPLAIIEDVPFVEFRGQDPSAEELKTVNLSLEDDLFAPFLNIDKWRPGGRRKK